jgi:hypothetical protein
MVSKTGSGFAPSPGPAAVIPLQYGVPEPAWDFEIGPEACERAGTWGRA